MSSAATPPVDVHALRLDDARALLEHDGTELPAPADGPTAYLQRIIDGLCELSLRDPLTGLANRRHFRAVLSREIEIVARSGNSALLLMLDIDHFKKINDTHGHLAGDKVLQAVARCIASCVRPQDTVARYGGEEFAIVMPDCQAAYGETVAERVRQSVAALSIPASPVINLEITTSVGGAFAPVWVRSTADLWIERADTQLYLAKAQGRNRVCIDHQQVISVSPEEKSLLFGNLALADSAWGDLTDSSTQRFS
ncbi:GGDEF domain-containing protein [Curvibacter sp. PAE-UM]|uniref:GGDEF domain-containing protein n=1 Tax=Curvibacter sp. PAE-UM TaxID=1714344 RepID=UPI00070B8D2E|nr:GGDEF domain-containing protein [Curvibacter sp. PAE-UM]KRH99185.1 diguanylate cyclase [Curvibacter sp. PAE-UM]